MAIRLNARACRRCETCEPLLMCSEECMAAIDLDADGYPVINGEICLDCGLCVPLCPFDALQWE